MENSQAMLHTLQVFAKDRPAMLERMLRVTRHRGFQVRNLDLQTSQEQGSVTISFTVSGERPIRALETQLSKLVDVSSVAVQSPMEQPISALG